MRRLDIKPLSVNEVWKGKRFKTKAYNDYEKEVLLMLKPMEVKSGKLLLFLRFGLSSKNADYDNPIKPFQDILSKKFGFNDRHIYKAIIEKVDVPKGKEFIEFDIQPII